VSEQVLDCTNIDTALHKMGGKAMPEDMAGDALLNAGIFRCLTDSGLVSSAGNVVAAFHFGLARIATQFTRRPKPEPLPAETGLWVLSVECAGQEHRTDFLVTIVVERPADVLQVILKSGRETFGQGHIAILIPFTRADLDQSIGEIEILDPKAKQFHQPHTAAVLQASDQFWTGVQFMKESVNFIACQHDGEVFSDCSFSIVFEIADGSFDDLFVKKNEGIQGLPLGACANFTNGGEVIQII